MIHGDQWKRSRLSNSRASVWKRYSLYSLQEYLGCCKYAVESDMVQLPPRVRFSTAIIPHWKTSWCSRGVRSAVLQQLTPTEILPQGFYRHYNTHFQDFHSQNIPDFGVFQQSIMHFKGLFPGTIFELSSRVPEKKHALGFLLWHKAAVTDIQYHETLASKQMHNFQPHLSSIATH